MKRGVLWSLFRKDVGRKLVALALALVVWFVLGERLSGEREVILDVELVTRRSDAEQARRERPGIFVVVPEHLIMRNLVHRQITLTLKGLKDDIEGLELSAVLEVPAEALGQADEVEHSFLLDRSMFRASTGTIAASEFAIQPRRITLSLAERTRQTFDLDASNVRVVGVPRAGHYVDTTLCRVEPNQVELTGPRSAIAHLRADPGALLLEPVDVDGQALDVVRVVGLDRSVVDPGITLMTAGSVVSVVVPVRPEETEVELLSVRVHYDFADTLATRNLQLVEATPALDLIVSGPRHVLDALSEAQLRKAITLKYDWRDAGFEIATDQVRIHTSLPDAVEVLGLDRRGPEIQYQLAPVEAVAPEPAPPGGEFP